MPIGLGWALGEAMGAGSRVLVGCSALGQPWGTLLPFARRLQALGSLLGYIGRALTSSLLHPPCFCSEPDSRPCGDQEAHRCPAPAAPGLWMLT